MKRVVWVLVVLGALSGAVIVLGFLTGGRGMNSFSVSTSEAPAARAAFGTWIARQGFKEVSVSEEETRYEGPVTLRLQKGSCVLEWTHSAWTGEARMREVDALKARVRAWWDAYPRP